MLIHAVQITDLGISYLLFFRDVSRNPGLVLQNDTFHGLTKLFSL